MTRSRLLLAVGGLALGLIVSWLWVRGASVVKPHKCGAALIDGAIEVAAHVRGNDALPISDAEEELAHREPAGELAGKSAIVTVIVLSPIGRGVETADVVLVVDEVIYATTQTDAAGQCRFVVPDGESRLVTVSAQGWQASSQSIPTPSPGQVLIHLTEGGRLRGIARWQGSHAPVVDGVVFAWPDGYVPKGLGCNIANRETQLDRPDLLSTHTDTEGRFVVEGLNPEKGYTLTAIAPAGFATERSVGNRPIAHFDIELEVARVYGALVHLREPDGSSLQCGARVYAGGAVWHQAGEEDEEDDIRKPVTRITCEVAAVLPKGIRDDSLTATPDHLLLLTSDSAEDDGVTIEYAAHPAGYEAVWTELAAARLDKDLPEYEINVTPTARGWGSLEISCSGVSTGIVPDSITNARLGVIHLLEADGSRLSVVVEKPCGQGVQRVDGIPYGNYQAFFQMRDMAFEYPAEGARATVTIGEVTAQLQLPFDGVGAILLSVNDIAGGEYTGEVIFRLRENWNVSYFSFNRAPYVMENLPAGDYELAFERLPGLDAEKQPRCAFQVVPGEIATPSTALVR